MQMRYCLMWQSNINCFMCMFLSLFLGHLLIQKCFCDSTAMILCEYSAFALIGLFWKLCSFVRFMYQICCVCSLLICRWIYELKPCFSPPRFTTSREICRMAVRWWCLSYLKTSVTAFLSPWSSTSWILLTLSCRGQKVQVLMMGSLSPSNSHRVCDFPQMLSVMNEQILEMQSSAVSFV